MAPPRRARIELAVARDVSVAAVDEAGNAIGGLRSPFVDFALSTYKAHATSGGLFMLTGHEVPLHRDTLLARYQTLDSYLAKFTSALERAIAAGDLLELDRDELLSSQQTKARAAFAPDSV